MEPHEETGIVAELPLYDVHEPGHVLVVVPVEVHPHGYLEIFGPNRFHPLRHRKLSISADSPLSTALKALSKSL
jgi:hypothetical protein